uniref:Putative papain-like cysteine prorease n=1 Tax=Plasmodium hylobati TaxID=77520 RepID=F1SYZ3_PLAHY|nr:putative papain-like cysteine prorease [Plasmodium hylobati]
MRSSLFLLLALGAVYGNNVAMCTESPSLPTEGSGGSSSDSSVPGTGTENQGTSGSGAQNVPGPNPSQTVQTESQNGDGSPSTNITAPTPKESVSDSSSGSSTGQEVATQPQASPQKAPVQSALLKNLKGVRVTGPCNTEVVGLFLIPHIYISVNAASDTIELTSKFPNSDNLLLEFKKEKEELLNKCENSSEKTFKFIVHLEDNILTLKWIVYPPTNEENKNKADVRKYRLPKLERPVTSIQVHEGIVEGDTIVYTSKDYSLKNDIPELCQGYISSCFLSGNTDIESCYTCNLLIHNDNTNDKCFDYVSEDFKNEFLDIKVKGQDDEESSEYKVAQAIDAVLNGLYKTHPNGKKELITSEELDENVKKQIGNYCHVLKELDTTGTLKVHEMGNEIDVFNNLVKLLQKHGEEKKSTLEWKLQNPALCLKNVNDWVVNKKGLVLPTLQNGGSDIHFGDSNDMEDEKKSKHSTYEEGADGIIDLSVVHKNAHASSTQFSNPMFCNRDYCDRTKDTTSCMAKIEAGDQGLCATSWVFASKVHLETIKCMKGYEHVPSSALYVANCANKDAKDKCEVPSNPLEFLDILEKTKFLPSESDLPYSYQQVENVCPEPKSHWKNLWANVKLLDPQNGPNSVSTKGYTAYQSDHFKGNMDAFIKLVKSEVMNKGSVIAYVKASGALSYDLNGKKVLSLCGGEAPDLAVNIIGYGNYINGEGVKKSYWLVRNSWGKHWGDNGNFKVDMHGPDGCQHNFIHTAAVFNLDVSPFHSPAKEAKLYNYSLKSSPDFYKNLYYNALGEQKGKAPSHAIHGQDEMHVIELGEEDEEEGSPHSTDPKQPPQSPAPPVENTDSIGKEAGVPPPPQEAVEGQPSPAQPTAGGEAPTTPATDATEGEKSEEEEENPKLPHIVHVLKHIKQTKMVTRIVTYEGGYELGDPSCSRTQATTVEKLDECIGFCNENLDMCKRTVSPGYCLTKLRKTNDCIFCSV